MFRPYQDQALTEILISLNNGENPLLHLDTGAGKTFIFCELLKRIHSKGKRALMIVRGRQLVEQAYARLIRESVPCGVLMAGHFAFRLREPIQVCSIDTLVARGLKPEADLIIIDEADLATSAGYKKFLSKYTCPILSVTATPYNPLGHLANRVIRPITFNKLVEQGYLVPPKYFCPTLPDLKGIKTTKGDYAQNDLSKRMSFLVGDIVSHYKTIANGRSAICFCVTINHSKMVAQLFNDNGISAIHADADTEMGARMEAIDGLRSGKYKVICNVGILGRGIDVPWVDCIIMGRPTKSQNLFLQQLGRGTRPYPGKTDFILLDHSGNVLRHGLAEEERPANLTVNESFTRIKSPTTCLTCFNVFYSSACPSCGNVNPVKLRKLEVKDGELVELKAVTPEMEMARNRAAIDRMRKEKKYKLGWRWFEAKRLYGEAVADIMFPKRILPDWLKQNIQNSKKKSLSDTAVIQG